MNGTRFLRCMTVGAVAVGLMACGSDDGDDAGSGAGVLDDGQARTDECPTGKCDSPNAAATFKHQWAVDMKRVREHYGRSSKFFFGLAPEEAQLPPGLPGTDKPVWDQMARRNPDHSLHIDSKQDPTVKENIQLIMEDGTAIDPPGFVNIVPLLRDTDPTKQQALRSLMQNGDIIVYFHPEYTEIKDQMERRTSHVAMHYDIKDPATGRELVHHIDNPNSYGPRYNHRPDRRMPFHVYRFQPRPDKQFGGAPVSGDIQKTVEGVEFTAKQVDAVIELVNTADLNTLDVTIALDARAARNILNAREAAGRIDDLVALGRIPYVGPSALTRLRDAVEVSESGFTIDAAMAAMYGDQSMRWGMIDNDLSPFANFFTLTLQKKDELIDFAERALNNTNMQALYCSGLVYANLNLALNFPLNQLALGDDLWGAFKTNRYLFSDIDGEVTQADLQDGNNLPSIDRLVFESYAATDLLTAWVDVNLGNLPMPVRKGLIAQDAVLQQIVGGFRQLEWSDDHPDKNQSVEFPPATIENVRRWAKAYGLTEADTQTFLEADPELFAKFQNLGIDLTGLTPMDVVQAVEREFVANRFVPPRIWLDEADKADSNLIYVGTVLNCELLVADDGSGADPCGGGGAGVDEFGEGAAETSTYPHYRVSNGGERTHRRFDASVGPERWGQGTKMKAGLTAASTEDIVFLLHVPEHWKGHEMASSSMMEYDGYCTERNPAATCAPEKGIAFPAKDYATEASLNATELRFDVTDVCELLDDDTARCNVATRQTDGSYAFAQEEVSRNAHGLFSMTLVDLGHQSASVELERCTECATGGAQYNVWSLIVRND